MLKARFLAFSLTLIIIISSLFGCSEGSAPKATQKRPAATERETQPSIPEEQIPIENKVVVGNTLALSGKFRFPSTEGADGEIYSLTNGYSTLAMSSGGSYVWDTTVVKSHTEESINGNTVITIELHDDLLFSDGTPVKAKNYLAYLLAFSSPIASAAGFASDAGSAFVGYEEFAVYNGTNDGKTAIFVEKDGSEKRVVASKSFSGVHLINDYTFSLTLKSDKLSRFYEYVTASLTPHVIELILGADVSVKESNKGVYLDGPWYERKTGVYVKASHLSSACRNLVDYAFSGPYVISDWDPQKQKCTLTINANYKGNYEGIKPSIETLVYIKLVKEIQLDALALGVVDIISGLSGSDGAGEALDAVRASGGSLASSYYLDPGYRKLSLNCNYGATSFLSVRRALSYALDSEQNAKELADGYGFAIYAPYSAEFDMWQQWEGHIELTKYSYSLKNAKDALVKDGWIYNADGSTYNEKLGGVRYKKLSAKEAEAADGANLSYSVTVGETEYKTELVGEEYFIPCAISWLGNENDKFTSLISKRLIEDKLAESLGIAISLTLSSKGDPSSSVYGMYSAEETWCSAIYERDGADNISDPYDVLFPYGEGGMSLGEALECSGGKLGLDYLSKAMLLDSSTTEEYNEWWGEYLERWNALIPEISLCTSYRFDFYNTKIKGLDTSPFRSIAEAIVYCSVE